jgi:hypothetical protein
MLIRLSARALSVATGATNKEKNNVKIRAGLFMENSFGIGAVV